MNWHRLSITEIFQIFGTSSRGYSSAEAEEKLKQFGPNELTEGKKRTIGGILWKQFGDVITLILLAAAVVSGMIGDVTDTFVILFIIFLSALIGFFQEYRAEKALHALKKIAVHQVRVLRDKKKCRLPATVLVPGDIVFIEAGNTIPADGRIIESDNLKIEEAALTGESNAVDKIADPLETEDLSLGDRKNMVFKGTFAAYGQGTAIIVATGMQTELGHIAGMLQVKKTRSPLQQKMSSLGRRLSISILILCALFFIAGWLRGDPVLKLALTAIALAVAAIPEALPTVITISLALAAKKMTLFNCLVRNLPTIEALGSVTYICTDKTGTLTKNKMHVENIFVNGRLYERNELDLLKREPPGNLLLYAFALNNDVLVDNQWLKGDSTEIALLEVAGKQDIQAADWPRMAQISFDSERKLMTTFHKHKDKIISFTKGAPEVLIPRCDIAGRKAFLNCLDEMTLKGYRVLGFAYRYWDALPEIPTSEFHETNLHFLGLAALTDPPREEVYDAVLQCKTAGIVPVMITGDHPITAKIIAQKIGIISNKDDLILTGQELAALSDKNFISKADTIKVYARVSPEQKLRVVKLLQDGGHYVAMTGDGINDAPSLKKANIGIAMGSGTEVAKDASDMVLLDDNFSTIIKAVKEGRRVYDNILKFVKYIMATNTSEILTLLLGPMIGLPVALLPIHILWLNLTSDGLPAISLSFEKAENDIMNRPPRPPGQSVFSDGRGLYMIWVGILMAGIALSLQYWAVKNGSPWQTMIFDFLCLAQLGHVVAIRSEKELWLKMGMFSNKLLIITGLLTLFLQSVVTFTPFLQPIFKTETLTAKEFILVGLAALLVYLVVEIKKILSKQYTGSKN